MKIKLYIFKKGNNFREILVNPVGHRKELPLFGVTNSLLEFLPKKFPLGLTDKQSQDILQNLTAELEVLKGINFESADVDKKYRSLVSELLKAELHYHDGHIERPLQLNNLFHRARWQEGFIFGLEFTSINGAIINWLKPKGKGRAGSTNKPRPADRFAETWSDDSALDLSPLNLEQELYNLMWQVDTNGADWDKAFKLVLFVFLHMARQTRNRQFSSETTAVEDKEIIKKYGNGSKHTREKNFTSKLFVSESGILPLVWAEILFAVDNNIYGKHCTICRKLFPVKNYNAEFCSANCRSISKRKAASKKRWASQT